MLCKSILSVSLCVLIFLNLGFAEKDYHILRGIDYIYEENYEAAYKEFDTLITIYPNDPEGFFYLSALLETILSFKPDPEMEARLDSIANTGVRLAEKKLKLQNNAYNLFYVGSTRGERAVQRALKGNWLGCLIDGIGARKSLELAIREDSTLFDIYMGFGLYDYWLGKYLSFIPWLRGRKSEGINELKLASLHGKYAQRPADFFLLRVYLLEEMWDEAIDCIKRLQMIYPTNTALFCDEAEVHYNKGEWQKAVEVCKQSLLLSEHKKTRNPRVRGTCYLMLAKSYNKLKEIEAARTNCDLTIKVAEGFSLRNEVWAKDLKKEAQKLLQKCTL